MPFILNPKIQEKAQEIIFQTRLLEEMLHELNKELKGPFLVDNLERPDEFKPEEDDE